MGSASEKSFGTPPSATKPDGVVPLLAAGTLAVFTWGLLIKEIVETERDRRSDINLREQNRDLLRSQVAVTMQSGDIEICSTTDHRMSHFDLRHVGTFLRCEPLLEEKHAVPMDEVGETTDNADLQC